MIESPPTEAGKRRSAVLLDLALALGLALILSTGWSINDWPRLSHGLLPDPDDMMRLAQVRDWLAGQGINDWTQYRMAPPLGSPMHWSRINDFGIAAVILGLTPMLGRVHAEIAAVLFYPGLLFACAMFLSARIARRMWGAEAGPVAALFMALAYPGTTVFIPGRIDHHALQVVLIQLLVLALMHAPGLRSGAAAGLLTALSLIVGLETAPQLAALLSVMALFWLCRGAEERTRLAGFAAALGSTTLFFLAFLRPGYWTAALCDAFTPASSTAMLAVAGAMVVLAALTPWLRDWRRRLGAGALMGGMAIAGTLIAFPSCISGPYGVMDPFLRIAFLPYIDEANGLLQLRRLAKIVAIGGMLATGCMVALWALAREPRRWPVLLPDAAVVLASGLVMWAQVRGVYIGAPLAAPMLAVLVTRARRQHRRRLPLVIGAWLAGAGMVYVTAADQIELRLQRRSAGAPATGLHPPKAQVLCSAGDAWTQVDRASPGVILAGTNVAAYVIGATHHTTIGAGYHRNDRGNMAMYRFFLGKPDQSREIASAWRADYVLFCPGDFDEIQVATNFPASLAAQLRAGRRPDWLAAIPLKGTPLRFYRIRKKR